MKIVLSTGAALFSLFALASIPAAKAADIGETISNMTAGIVDPVEDTEAKSGLYFGGRSRIMALDDTSFDTRAGGNVADYDVGFSGSVLAGYAFAPAGSAVGIRAELEANYFDADINQLTVNGITRTEQDSTGSLQAITGYVSGFVDLNLGHSERFSGSVIGRLSPFIGAGIGYSHVTMSEQGSFTDGLLIDDSDDAMAYHLSAGVGFALREKTTVEIGYRYEEIMDAEFTALDGTVSTSDISRQSVTIGLRRRF